MSDDFWQQIPALFSRVLSLRFWCPKVDFCHWPMRFNFTA